MSTSGFGTLVNTLSGRTFARSFQHLEQEWASTTSLHQGPSGSQLWTFGSCSGSSNGLWLRSYYLIKSVAAQCMCSLLTRPLARLIARSIRRFDRLVILGTYIPLSSVSSPARRFFTSPLHACSLHARHFCFNMSCTNAWHLQCSV